METKTKKQVQILVENAQQLYGDLSSLQKEITIVDAAVKQDPDLSTSPELLRQMQDIRDELGLGTPSATIKVVPPGNPNDCHWCTASGGV
jgi:hypothetical protein